MSSNSLISNYNQQRTCADKRSICHAPSYGMHLAQNGLVSACSLTRLDSLGKYPEMSLEEIWWGEKAVAFRKAMRGNAFPSSCNICQSDAQASLYQQMRANAYDQYARSPFDKLLTQAQNYLQHKHFGEYPRQMSFELTNTCNLECVMCMGMLSSSIRQNRDKLPPLPQHYGEELLEQLKVFIPHLQEASFYGGEPFLIPLYLDIWELFVKLNPNCKIYITTNGTILNNRVKAILESLSNFQLVVSLDGITAPTFEKIRINANFERVLDNVRYFKSVCEKHNRRLIISPTYMQANWAEYPLLLDFANKENFIFQTNILITPTELSLAYATPEVLEEVYNTWKNHSAAPAVSPEQGLYNQKAFDGATAQIAAWLQELNDFKAHPQGAVLFSFSPQNKLEVCLSKYLTATLRRTQDPALPLRLLELWADNDATPALTYWQGVKRLAILFYPQLSLPEDKSIIEYLSSLNTAQQLHIVQQLLVKTAPWHIFKLIEEGSAESLLVLFQGASSASPIPDIKADFF